MKAKNNQYFEVTTGHRDWGNDSDESRQTYDICPNCIVKFIKDYLTDCSDTAYLDLETETVWARKESKVVNTPPKEGEVERKEHEYY